MENIRTFNVFIQNRYLIPLILILLLALFGCGSGGGGGSASIESIDQESSSSETVPASNSTGSVNLSWAAPVSNENGSHLNDLAGYTIYYRPYSHTHEQSIDNGNYTGATISDLSPGTWCFSITAYDLAGNESDHSAEVCKEVITI